MAAVEGLKHLLENVRVELWGRGDDFGEFLKQLEAMTASLDDGEVSGEALKATLDAFPLKLRPTRAGAPIREGLKETTKLWEELNHIVRARQENKK